MNISSTRMQIHTSVNRLEDAVQYLSDYQSNMVDGLNRVTEVDFVQENVPISKTEILQRAGTAMPSQANAMPQSVLSRPI